jgi:hypothetical protein
MNHLRIFIPAGALDAYVYSGYLFAIFKDGTLRVLSLQRIYESLASQHARFEGTLHLAILRNDWQDNSQALVYGAIRKFRRALEKEWQDAALNRFTIELDHDRDWQILSEVPSMPIYDFRFYANRAYLAHRDGVREGRLSFYHNEVRLENSLVKIFDARTVNITARSGNLMFSADNDGLYSGSLWNEEKTTKVSSRSYAKKSLRTGWSSFDVVNYERQSYFSYLENEIERRKARRPFRYSEIDEYPEKIEIVRIAKKIYSMDEVLKKVPFKSSDVQYCFNSATACFFFLKDGRFVHVNFARELHNEIRLRSKIHDLSFGAQDIISNNPCSAVTFPLGCVIEYFDRVLLFHDNRVVTLEDSPVISVRTFPASRRFRRQVCITREDGIALHVVFPTEEEISRINEPKRVQRMAGAAA